MTTYADTFDRADTAAGSGLGTTDTGSLAWTTITGTGWRILNNQASTADTPSNNPLCVVDPSTADVEASVQVGQYGGDCLYFRVVDATNWWRIRKSSSTSYSVNVGSWSSWSDWSADIYGCGATYSPCNAGYDNYVYGYATLDRDCEKCIGPCSFSYRKRTRTRQVTLGGTTNYLISVEKSVAGVVTEEFATSQSSDYVKVRASGDDIEVFRGVLPFGETSPTWYSLTTLTDSTHNTATKHGVGRGSSTNDTNALDDFNLNTLEAAVPTAITPVNLGSVATDTPTLGATITTTGAVSLNQIAQWQIATNAGFTANLRTVTEPSSDQRELGPTTEVVPIGEALYQGTWNLRARALMPGGGGESAWTSTTTFTVSHPPAAANLWPTGGSSISVVADNMEFDWVFSDSSPVDVQTAYEIQVERASDSLLIYSSGKVASSSATAVVPIDNAYVDNGIGLQWRIRLYDRDDVVGSWSSFAQFSAVTAPTVAVSSPDNFSTITSPSITVSWVYTAYLAQSAYRVFVYQGASAIHDTGWVTGSASSYATPVLFQDQFSYVISVVVRDTAGNESASSSVDVDAAWTNPNSTTVMIFDRTDTFGYVDLQWDQVNNDDQFVSWTVLRRVAGTSSWESVYVTFENLDTGYYQFQDFYALVGVDYEYSLVQTATRFGGEVTSKLGGSLVGTWNFTAGSGNASVEGEATLIAGELSLNAIDDNGADQSVGLSTVTAGGVIMSGNWSFLVSSVISPAILNDAVLWLDASNSAPGETEAANQGVGGAALNADYPGTAGDPVVLDHTGTNYVYLPGTAANDIYIDGASAASYTPSGDNLDINVQVDLDDWTPASNMSLLSCLNWGVSGYELSLNTDGTLTAVFVLSGGNQLKTSTEAVPFTSGKHWLRVTRNVTSGDVDFYTSDDAIVWAPLGTTVSSTAGAIVTPTLRLGCSRSTSQSTQGKVFRILVIDDASTLVDINPAQDVTDASATSFTASSGQTVSVSRSTTLFKTALVVRSAWLFGGSQRLVVPHSTDLNFDDTSGFTVMAIGRYWNSDVGVVVDKSGGPWSTGNTGWSLYDDNRWRIIESSTYTNVQGSPSWTNGQLSTTFGVIADGGAMSLYMDGVDVSDSSPNPADASSSVDLWIGEHSNAVGSGTTAEVLAVAVWNRALSQDEINIISAFYAGSGDSAYFKFTGTEVGDTPSDGATPFLDVSKVTPNSTHYWMLFPDSGSESFRLPLVTGEKFSEEYERAEFNIIGKGRHVDLGERIGIKGSLSIQLRGDSYLGLTARDQLDLLRGAASRDEVAYVRNPFGDLWAVNLGDMSYDRMPGVGINEYCNVEIPYSEVYR